MARGNDLVDLLLVVSGNLDRKRAEVVLELLHAAGAEYGCRHSRFLHEPANRDLGRRPSNRARDREKLIDDYKARFANPYTAAERGYIDDVIVPHETRPKLIAALHTLLTKREPGPKRKHGNIPL